MKGNMLRIANYYDGSFRNDGNPLYFTHDVKLRSKDDKKIEVNHVRPEASTIEHLGHYDAHVWCDWGEDGLRHILPYPVSFPVRNGTDPVVYWPTDTHINGDSYAYRLSLAKRSDIVYTAQKVTVEQFAADGVTATWLPCGFEPLAYPKYELAAKTYDVCFVGHINTPNRIEALDRLFKEFPEFYFGQLAFEDAAHKYAESKICFNIALNNDVNMRCFEVTGSGNFLLTNRIPSLEELFVDGKEIVMYDDLDDMVAKAKYYLEHDEEREAIAAAGYARSMKDHRFSKRVDIILNDIKKFKEKV